MTTATPEQLTQAWNALQALVPVHVIHTEQQYDRAVVALNMLIDIEVGEPSVVQAVLAGEQSLTPPHLHALARRFGVVPETFMIG